MKTIPAFFIKFESATLKTPKTIEYACNLQFADKGCFVCTSTNFTGFDASLFGLI